MSSDPGVFRQDGVRLLLDTAFCLALTRASSPAIARALEGFAPGELAVSSLTVAALRARAERSGQPERNLQALERFLLPLEVVDFVGEAALIAGRLAAAWGVSAAGEAPLVAAQAVQLGAILVTSRPERYAPAPGLRINEGDALPLLGAVALSEAPQPQAAPSLRPVPGTIVAIGSHDLTLDLLGDSLHAAHPELTLVSAHVGSLGGLLALQRREAHLAGSHLLDEESGDYNIPYIRRLLTPYGCRVILLGFVERVQGLIVAKGNPKRIGDLPDLLRRDVTFVNRQTGAGTRVLLDYALKQRNLAANRIRGYERQEASHLSVATAVASGAADCGLGIEAVARAHDLDFVPLFGERYDLVIPVEHYESPLLAPLLALLRRPSPDFLARVSALGGYRTPALGQVLAEIA